MASKFLNFLLITFFLLIKTSSAIFIPLTKHPQTSQHLTQIFHTSQLSPTTLFLDLNSPFLHLTTSSNTSLSVVPRRSIHCSATGLDHSGPLDEFCKFKLQNPVTGESGVVQLVQDDIAFGSQKLVVDEFFHVLSPSKMLSGLVGTVKGVLGLGKNRVGVVEQVSHFFGLSKKFTICLSSTNGMIYFGENNQIDVSNSMIYTPILMGNRDSYQINLKSIKVQNRKLSLQQHQQPSTIEISTISPYTLMETKIYKEIIHAFATESEIMGMKRVNPVGQFELCFNMKVNNKVPIIDLLLQSEMVKWRIYGHNSMVKMNDNVMCLGILDGGNELNASIILGSYQLEDNLVEFDLGRSMFGFSSSLLMKQTSCSLLRPLSKDVQSL